MIGRLLSLRKMVLTLRWGGVGAHVVPLSAGGQVSEPVTRHGLSLGPEGVITLVVFMPPLSPDWHVF